MVRGTITDLQTRDRNDSGFQDAHIDVLISEVLKGEPVSEEAGTVEVVIGDGYDLGRLRSELPSHDHMWFLKKADEGSAAYYTTDFEQISVFRDIDGVVRVIGPEYTKRMYNARQFPVPLEGTSFEDLVERVRDLVEHGAAPGGLARMSSFAC